ncbi:hypothetical protein AVEN_7225-1 [Araneus ventricosus]|uniref:Uncharacterized protein n=1 Tax=Araneus ventricosus TaxID=182803 RepID=A0A4Y2IL92_ARAVE|nr:hypothetical protein AVEN_7225-1 [Araneus ventricosus]
MISLETLVWVAAPKPTARLALKLTTRLAPKSTIILAPKLTTRLAPKLTTRLAPKSTTRLDHKSTTRLAPKSTTTEFIKLLDKIINVLVNSPRSDVAFSKYVNDASALATNFDINVEFPFKRHREFVFSIMNALIKRQKTQTYYLKYNFTQQLWMLLRILFKKGLTL